MNKMERCIKFRGKRVDNGEWVSGDLMRNTEDDKLYIVVDNRAFRYIPSTMSSYTGREDKNGTEIYGGDILMLGGYKCVVEWNKTICAFCIRFSFEEEVGSKPLGSWLEEYRECEVIGNVMENPELLNTPNSGELKLQHIDNVPFRAADRVKIIGASNEAYKCLIGEIGEVIDIDSVNHTCFVLYRKGQAWIRWNDLELYSKES